MDRSVGIMLKNLEVSLGIGLQVGNVRACDDVVVDILCRLPGKDLMRFKCVCRAWHRIICEVCIPMFTLNPPLSCLSVKVVTYGRGPSWFEHMDVGEEGSGCISRSIADAWHILPFYHSSDCLLDSCNGLLLFCSQDGPWYYVYNPTIRQFELLPGHTKCSSATLAFNPCKSPHYKVVGFTPSGETRVVMDVYSSESGRWAGHVLALDHLASYERWYHGNMIFFYGTIYCMSGTRYLLCFDLDMVKACRIDLPESEQYILLGRGILGASSGHLCFARFYMDELYESRSTILEFFECEGGKWFLKHRVTYDFMKEVPPSLMLHPEALFLYSYGIHPSSHIIFFGTSRVILSYDFESNTFKEVARTRKGTYFEIPVYTHVQCLTSFAKAGTRKCLTSFAKAGTKKSKSL